VKSSRVVLSGFVVMSLLMVFSASALAGQYICEVKRAGPYGTSEVRFVLTHKGTGAEFADKTFKANVGREKEMLAVALSAMSGGLNIIAYTNPTSGTIPVITSMYLVQ
jgi:hypothetical protein